MKRIAKCSLQNKHGGRVMSIPLIIISRIANNGWVAVHPSQRVTLNVGRKSGISQIARGQDFFGKDMHPETGGRRGRSKIHELHNKSPPLSFLSQKRFSGRGVFGFLVRVVVFRNSMFLHRRIGLFSYVRRMVADP
ncbi:hypothetical protein CDAR_521831 [Caerostris darwini]|uniref:Ribosomal protein L2 n=1 Tax=Caerostris darwini TaxID=1538125 RepID=A0AAV4RVN6_9ARAC|nr:hypothetical protein CDAR_521831 [Caerostris darwini]